MRREIAAIAALAYLVLCQPVYPVANRHWLVTFVGLALLYVCLGTRSDRRVDLVGGILAGVLISTHQQRGVGMASAFVTWMLASHLVDRRFGAKSVVPLRASAVSFAIGVIAVVVPVLAVVTWRAGVEQVWYALIVHPLTHYLGTIQTTWGRGGPHFGKNTFPLLLRTLPIALVPIGLRLAVLVRGRRDLAESRSLLAVLIFGLFAALSILYYPDLTHLAFIAPFFFVALAWACEWGLSTVPSRVAAIAARVALALFFIASASSLIARWRFEHRAYRVPRMTAFGRIDFARGSAAQFDELQRRLAEQDVGVVYIHPISSFFYLMLGVRNPTRFEFFFPGTYNTMEQAEEVLAALRSEGVEWVFFPLPGILRGDVVVRYVDEHYEPVDRQRRLWRRK